MHTDGVSLEARPDPNSHSMLVALWIITETDRLVSDSCRVQCFHQSLLIGGLGPTYLYADNALSFARM